MGSNRTPSSWGEAHVARLREHYASGASFSIIARKLNEEFGSRFTRNACIGKCTRLLLDKRLPLDKRQTPTKREHQPLGPPKGVPHGWKRTPFQVHPLGRPEFHTGDPNGPGITIYMLKKHSCRWPVVDIGPAKFLFCGYQVEQDRSWCSHHRAIAVRPPR